MTETFGQHVVSNPLTQKTHWTQEQAAKSFKCDCWEQDPRPTTWVGGPVSSAIVASGNMLKKENVQSADPESHGTWRSRCGGPCPSPLVMVVVALSLTLCGGVVALAFHGDGGWPLLSHLGHCDGLTGLGCSRLSKISPCATNETKSGAPTEKAVKES